LLAAAVQQVATAAAVAQVVLELLLHSASVLHLQ
jgi:hypothetical protein